MTNFAKAHDSWLQPPDREYRLPQGAIGCCELCSDLVMEDEARYHIQDEVVHEDCWDDYCLKRLRAERRVG